MPETGLEPAHVTIPDPKSGASANFATPAKNPNGENTFGCNNVAIRLKGNILYEVLLTIRLTYSPSDSFQFPLKELIFRSKLCELRGFRYFMINKILFLLTICCALFSGKVFAQWKSDSTSNTPVCVAVNTQQNLQSCSDGSNGIIIVWEDLRNTSVDIYAQKLNADGVPQWAANGINICTSTAAQTSPVICSDGNGGAYVA